MVALAGVLIAFNQAIAAPAAPATAPSPTTLPVVIKKGDVTTEIRAIATGTRAADGWVSAHSELGHFHVMLPAPYNDFTVSGRSVKGNPVKTHALGMTIPGRAKFAILRMIGGDNPQDDATAKSIAESAAADNWPFSKLKTIDAKDGKAYEYTIVGPHSAARGRTFVREGTMFMMTVEYPPTAPKTLDADIDRFFDSFRLDTPHE
jgi:hypothetical protein